MCEIEDRVTDIPNRHRLSGIHLFETDTLGWTAFGSRRQAGRYEASVESGIGKTIADAINSLDERLKAGPIRKPREKFIDPKPKQPSVAKTGVS